MLILFIYSILYIIPSINAFDEIEENVVLTKSKWTFMLYDDADFEHAWDPIDNFTMEVCSSENINIVVLQDTEYGSAKLWYIDKNHSKIFLEEKGEINMGDYTTLRDFIDFCKSNYPADRYLMDLYNHGAGWKGACKDDTSDGDLLTMNEMQKALTETDGIDIIIFNAPCLMGSVESVYELRDNVDVYIGSEELCGYKLGIAGSLCELLNTNPDIDTFQVGESFIGFIENMGGPWDHMRTMTAVRTDKIENLVNSIDKLSKDFIRYFFRHYNMIYNAHRETFELGEYNDVKERYRLFDLYEFTQNLLENNNLNSIIREDILALQYAFNDTIIKEYHGASKTRCNGLSIYFPYYFMDGLSIQYGKYSYGLDFTRDTFWNEFIGFYVIISQIFGD
jgi:hypothetical protein